MKRIHKSLYFIAAITAISFVSCQKQELESSTNGTRITINATVEPAMNTTKTHVVPEEGDIYNIEWDSNEHMRVIVYNSSTCNKLETTNFTLNDNGTGTFEAEIPSGEWTNISGIYPLSATDGTRSEDKQTDYRISLPQVQIPSRDSYDPKAFIMIARNTEVPEDLNNYVWNAYYYRATALNNFTIKNLEHADNIVNVKITFPEDELVAGYKRVDLTTCTVTGNRYQNSPNYIELKYTEPLSADASGNYELWFTTWEINVEPDETVKVEITTEDYKYTKSFTGNTAEFKENCLNLLALDMTGAEAEELTPADDYSGQYLIAANRKGSWLVMTPSYPKDYFEAQTADNVKASIADVSCEDFYYLYGIGDYAWTIAKQDNGYSICSSTGSYISISGKDVSFSSSPVALSVTKNDDGTFKIEEIGGILDRSLKSHDTMDRFKMYLNTEEKYPAPVLIPWTEETTPRIFIDETRIAVGSDAASGNISYLLKKAEFSAVKASVKDAAQWLSVSTSDNTISYNIEENTGDETRTAVIVISVDGGNSVEIEVIQTGKVAGGAEWSYTFKTKEDEGLSGNIFTFAEGRGLQLTKDHNAIYTKTDYSGEVNTVTLICSNNSSKGNGTATVTVGGIQLKYEGETSATISGCGTTDTEFTFTADTPVSGEIVVEVKASENSVYWKSITINKL